MTDSSKRFRVAFSFAGEKRDFVASLARILADRFGEAAILYDKYHEAEFAQWRLGLNLPALYRDQSDLIVVVVCSAYSEKNWCGLEWLAVHGMLMSGKNRDVMLCRFDYAELQGLYENAGFVELDHKTPEEAARRILERLALNEGKPKDHYIQDTGSAITGDKPDTSAPVDDDVKRPRRKWAIIAACLLVLAAMAYYILWGRIRPLTDKDTLLLADFTNNTGEQVFDNTLREALAIDFGQSPFLQMVSDRRIRETLRLMEHPPDQRITGEVAREVCLRTGSRATVVGTISKLGNHYPIQLKAVICDSEKVLAATEAEAGSREQTLQALHQAGSELRRKLGESREILKIYDKPLEEVTTSSLDALYAYSDAYRAWRKSGDFTVLPLMKKVVEIDPGFARAHHVLGEMYVNQGQATEGMEHLRRAFELRDRVSTREKYIITASYYRDVTGEFDKAREQYELWLHEYPREDVARNDFGNLLIGVGQYEKAVTVLQSAENPELSVYTNLIAAYGTLGRFREAKAALQAAFDKHLDGPILRRNAYVLAFSTNDQAGMRQQLSWAEGKPEFEEVLLANDSVTQAYFGSLQRARSLATQAAQIARRNGHGEAADRTLAGMGLREALLGNAAEAIGSANQALSGSHGRDVRVAATLALALAGQTARARTLADGMEREFPRDTMMQNYFLPCIHAALQIGQKQPSKALQILERTRDYEMGLMTSLEMLSPIYLRGQALLLAGDSTAAAAEFQRILERPALMANSYLWALAKLGLARAEALAISKAKDSDAARAAKTRARAAYQEFLTLWKDADPEIPILKQAKAEYAKL